MLRTLLLTSIVAGFTFAFASARETSPFRAFQGPDGKKPTPDSRGKIIDELRTDYNDVVDQFARKNVNEQMRAKQQRIIDNLKRLLEDEEPPQNPSGNAAPPSAPPPSGSNDPSPRPKPDPTPKKPQGNLSVPQERPKDVVGKNVAPPSSVEEMRKEKTTDSAWPPLPPRQREAIDAHGRDRFPPRYEELLRAYYRNIAESAGREKNE